MTILCIYCGHTFTFDPTSVSMWEDTENKNDNKPKKVMTKCPKCKEIVTVPIKQ